MHESNQGCGCQEPQIIDDQFRRLLLRRNPHGALALSHFFTGSPPRFQTDCPPTTRFSRSHPDAHRCTNDRLALDVLPYAMLVGSTT